MKRSLPRRQPSVFGIVASAIGWQLGCLALILAFNAFIGGWALNYILSSFIGKTIGWLPAGVVGLFLGEVTVPVALVCWVARLVGAHAPFIQ